MARTVTLGTIRTRIRQRADCVGSLFVTDAELNGLIDSARTELMDLLVKGEIHQFETAVTITTVAGTASYALPTDHYKTLAIDYQVSASPAVYAPLRELTFAERNLTGVVGASSYGASPAGYRLVGANIVLAPVPASAQTLRHTYIPAPTDISLAADATTIDGVAGWEEFIVIQAAINVKNKEEVTHSDLDRDLALIKMRIAEMSTDREPVKSIVDTRSGDYEDYGGYQWRRL